MKAQIQADNVVLVAAGLAFYTMMAVFPLLIAFVSMYGLVQDPADAKTLVSEVTQLMPESASQVFRARLNEIVETSPTQLGFGLLASVVTTLWSASAGVQAMMKAINLAYDEPETRPWWKLRLTSLALTAGILPAGMIALFLVAMLPSLLSVVAADTTSEHLASAIRWPLLALAMVVVLALVYRVAPDRKPPRWQWVTPGALVATTLWMAASAVFSVYTQSFGDYGATYGALGGFIVLLFWFFLSALFVLVGAELDAELERRARGSVPAGERKPSRSGRRYLEASRAHGRTSEGVPSHR
jgi:membrane protein